MPRTGPGAAGRVPVRDEGDGGRYRAVELDRMRGEERRAAISRVASTLSHALGTPLNVISGRAAMIGMREMSQEQLADNARIIREQVRAVADMLSRVLAFVREGWPAPEPTELGVLTRHVAGLVGPIAEEHGVPFQLGSVEEIAATVHGSRIEQVLVNLLTHAMAVGGRGGVSLSLARNDSDPPSYERGRARSGPTARFEVTVHGVTLPEPDYERVHEPWLGPEAGNAEQRALSMMYAVSFGIAREHHAWVELGVEPGVASTFSLCWPLSAA